MALITFRIDRQGRQYTVDNISLCREMSFTVESQVWKAGVFPEIAANSNPPSSPQTSILCKWCRRNTRRQDLLWNTLGFMTWLQSPSPPPLPRHCNVPKLSPHGSDVRFTDYRRRTGYSCGYDTELGSLKYTVHLECYSTPPLPRGVMLPQNSTVREVRGAKTQLFLRVCCRLLHTVHRSHLFRPLPHQDVFNVFRSRTKRRTRCSFTGSYNLPSLTLPNLAPFKHSFI